MHIRLLVLFCGLAGLFTILYRITPEEIKKPILSAVCRHIIPVLIAVSAVITVAVLFYSTGAISFS